jgi:hypothetical protein
VIRLAAAAGKTPHDAGFWHAITSHIHSGDVATALAAVIAAVIAVLAYTRQQREGRRQARATSYAEAMRVVEDYLEARHTGSCGVTAPQRRGVN